jgi:uroporphyrinogen III methyltransferase/synthase
VVAERLLEVGVAVRQVVAYQNVDNDPPPAELLAAMQSGKIDWVTVTSSAIADNLVRHFGPALGQTRIASISPITSRRLQQHGFEATVEAQVYTAQGIVDAILAHASHST